MLWWTWLLTSIRASCIFIKSKSTCSTTSFDINSLKQIINEKNPLLFKRWYNWIRIFKINFSKTWQIRGYFLLFCNNLYSYASKTKINWFKIIHEIIFTPILYTIVLSRRIFWKIGPIKFYRISSLIYNYKICFTTC
jgi:hypothetical protein